MRAFTHSFGIAACRAGGPTHAPRPLADKKMTRPPWDESLRGTTQIGAKAPACLFDNGENRGHGPCSKVIRRSAVSCRAYTLPGSLQARAVPVLFNASLL